MFHATTYREANMALHEAMEEREQSRLEKIREQQMKREKMAQNIIDIVEARKTAEKERPLMLEAARNDALSTALKAIYITALDPERITENGLVQAHNMVDKYIEENGGASSILASRKRTTYFLERLYQIVEECAQQAVYEVEHFDELLEDAIAKQTDGKNKKLSDYPGDKSPEEIHTDCDGSGKEEGTEKRTFDPMPFTKLTEDGHMDLDSIFLEADDESEDKKEEEKKDDSSDDDGEDEDIDVEVDLGIKDDDSDEGGEEKKDDDAADDTGKEDDGEKKDDDDADVDDDVKEVDSDDDDNGEDDDDEDVEKVDKGENDDAEEIKKKAKDLDLASQEADDDDDSNEEADDSEDAIEDDDVKKAVGDEPLDDDGEDSDDDIDGAGEEKGKIFDELDKEPDVKKAIEVIRNRIADAEETFIKNNAKDKKEISKLLDKISDNIKSAEGAEKDSAEAKITDEHVTALYRDIESIREDRQLTIFEKMTRELNKSILKNESILESYTDENGKLDQGLVCELALVEYAFLETLNTLQLERVDAAFLENVLVEM